MSGFLCAVGIAGSVVFSVGWSSRSEDPIGLPLVLSGAALLVGAAIGSLIRLV